MLVGDDLPELGPNLIAALAGLRFIRVRNELLLFEVLGKPRSTKKDEMYCKGLSCGLHPTWRCTISLILVFGEGRLEAD